MLRPVFPSLAFALALSGCAAIDPHNMLGRRFQPGEMQPVSPVPSPQVRATLSAEERGKAFDFVWTTIRDRYYDAKLNGVDWLAARTHFQPLALQAASDDVFWETLDRMTGELKDAHTRVESPKRAELIRRNEAVSLGFSFLPLEGRLVVVNVNSDSDAYWAGVRSGMSVVEIEGVPAQAAYEKLLSETRQDSTERSRHLRALRKIIAGDPDSRATFTFERADGTPLQATLTRRRMNTAASESHRLLPSGFGYIRFTQWTLGVQSRVVDAVRELRSAPGLIIDLRGNPGGSLNVVNNVLAQFFPRPIEVGRTLTRTGRPVALFFDTLQVIKLKQVIDGGPEAYAGPIVVLVSASSGSGSEFFAGAMQAVNRATIVGQQTCGCLLGYLGYAAIPGGGELAYSEVGFVMSNGKRIEGEGVIPDKVVPITMQDLRANRDRALEEAEALLKQRSGTIAAWSPPPQSPPAPSPSH